MKFEKQKLNSLESDEMWDTPVQFLFCGIHGASMVPTEPGKMYEQGFVRNHVCKSTRSRTSWKTWRAGCCSMLAKIVTTSCKLTRAASVSTRSNYCQQTDAKHQAHFSGSDFVHNRDCCYQKTRHNEDIFFQSFCTTPEDTIKTL